MNLEDQIASNRRKSYLILLLVPIILVSAAYVLGAAYGSPFGGLILGIIISLGYTLYTYYRSDSLILTATKAKLADEHHHKTLINLVEGLIIGAGLPMPKIYVQDCDDINAFAAGRDPEHGMVCVTTGALEKLNKTELEGVLAHELSHIKNYDIRFMTIVVAMVGAISILSQIFLRSLWFGSGRRREGGAIFIIIGLAIAILAPIFATLVQLAISRKREFLADASGAHLTRYPDGLASALEKIGKYNTAKMKVAKATAPLYIANPFRAASVRGLFSTHPPLEERVRRLRAM